MAIELHLCEGGDFRTTTDFLECGNCTAIIPNKTRADGVVTCGSCGSEWEPDEVPDARVEEIVQAVVDAANLRDNVRALRGAGQAVIDAWESGDLAEAVRQLNEAIEAAKEEA